MSAEWKKQNTKRPNNGKSNKISGLYNKGAQSQTPNVKYTYTVELGDQPPIEKTAEMFVGKAEGKGESGVLKLVNRKVRFDAVDMKDAAKVTDFWFTLTRAELLEDGEWRVIYEADEAEEVDGDDSSDE